VLLLVRHAEAVGNAEGRVMGHSDLPLTPRGRAQAEALAAWLRGQGVRFAAVYSSDLSRAVDTASALAAACGGGPVRVRAELREVGRGQVEGRTYAEAAELRRLPAVAESFERDQDVAARIRRGAAEMRQAAEGGAVAAVGHGGSISRLLRHFLGLPPIPHAGDAALFLANTGLCALDFSGGRTTLLCMNALPHFPPAELPWLQWRKG
jgi:probable phosphoglycerate mutase